MQGNLVDASAGAVVAFDVVVEEVEGGLGANYGEELLREVKGKVEGLRETVKESAMYLGLVKEQERRREQGDEQEQDEQQEQQEQREREVEAKPCCTICGKGFSNKQNARRHEVKQHGG